MSHPAPVQPDAFAAPNWQNRVQLWSWGLRVMLRNGVPRRALTFFGGIGDDIMATAVLRELHARGGRRLWMITKNPEVFRHNPYCAAALLEDRRLPPMLGRLSVPLESLRYEDYDPRTDAGTPPREHLISIMCRKAGISGLVQLKPELFLTATERNFGHFASRKIAIQSSGLGARYPMSNKEWGASRFQAVVDALRTDFEFVQLGSLSDPLLAHAQDFRGKLSLRETAGVLANSLLFVGLVGGLMHLARAVDCRSVIVYGGREGPWQSGYRCNVNVSPGPLPCSPCWRWNQCDFARVCLTSITEEMVIEAVRRAASASYQPLEVETASIRDEPRNDAA